MVSNHTARVFSDPTPMGPAARRTLEAALDSIRAVAARPQSDQRDADLETFLGRAANAAELQWSLMRRLGGEVDGDSRQLARYVDKIADVYVPNLDILMIYRLDRFGRGGHHTPFANVGFPAVRIMETNENYNRQHQDIRVEDGIEYGDVLAGVDFAFAAKMTGLNAAVMAALASAPGRPTAVTIRGAVEPSARLNWEPPADAANVAGYKVYWRLTDSPTWDNGRNVGNVTTYLFENLVIDNYYFGVASVAADGTESAVVFPLPGQ